MDDPPLAEERLDLSFPGNTLVLALISASGIAIGIIVVSMRQLALYQSNIIFYLISI